MKQWAELGKTLLKDKKIAVLCGVFAAGVLLLAISGGGAKKPAAVTADYYEIRESVETELEARAVRLLSSVEGVGKVRVLVTVERLQEIRYAENEAKNAGERASREFVTVETGGEKTGLPLTVYAPQVRGVGISCTGGGNPQIRKEAVELICAALGVSASKVHVSKLAE